MQHDRDLYIPPRNNSGSALWVGIAVLLALVIGGFLLMGPRGHETARAPSTITSQK